MLTRASRSDRYREEATRLRRQAERVHVPEARVELLSIAQQYETLAHRVEVISDHFARVLARLRRRP